MTGRRRHSTGGSNQHGGGSGPSRRPDTDGSGHHSGGGNGVGTDLGGIDTMAGRLDATRGRVDGVAATVSGVNLGPQSMGVIGSGFAGAAQSHLRHAEAQVARTTRAVEQAQHGTRGTAEAYRTTDTTSAANLSAIDTTTRPPDPAGAAGTTPSGTATAPSTPAAPPTPPGGGGPPTPPPGGPGGGPPHRPPAPPGGSGGPVSWREGLKNHFTPDEMRELDTAYRKMAADPRRGEVPGSGQLTPRERELVVRAQQLVVITPDTLMQKVLPPGALDDYLAGTIRDRPRFDANQVGGYVARQQDATHLRTPAEIIQGNRLDYQNSPFRDTSRPVHVMEFPAGNASYVTPFGAPFGGGSGTHQNWGVVQRAADDMIATAESQGLPPDSYRREVYRWPFSGIGVTADGEIGVPERTTPYHQIPDGSRIYEYSPSGAKVLVAEYVDSDRGWMDMRTR
ncbi:MAG TPA: hypothetical protein VFV67_21715 [Actinophytocola sp.]|uniref:WXG100 family type VII secretion target n=1 Tax=Actinophytocola sp. TaxID=1872138 RepID=UPI002DB73C94|nr:hypothetical protein [Actinophytocola sp.]HEU5473271.1 hypothetical protein [Actinophytocola sp.]